MSSPIGTLVHLHRPGSVVPGPPWHEMANSLAEAGLTDATANDCSGAGCATMHTRAAVKQASVRIRGRIYLDYYRSNFSAGEHSISGTRTSYAPKGDPFGSLSLPGRITPMLRLAAGAKFPLRFG